MGLLDFKVYVVHALRPEPDCSAQWQRIPAVPNSKVSLRCPTTKYPCKPPNILAQPSHQVFLQSLTTKYPCSVQPQSIPAVPNPSIPAVPNPQVSLQCLNEDYPCSAQLQSILAATTKYLTTKFPCSAQPQSIPAVPNRRASLQCPTTKCLTTSARPQSVFNNGFRVGMLEENKALVQEDAFALRENLGGKSISRG